MVWTNKRGLTWKRGVGYVNKDGKPVRYRRYKGIRNRKTGEFYRYGSSGIFLNDGRRHPNRGKPFKG